MRDGDGFAAPVNADDRAFQLVTLRVAGAVAASGERQEGEQGEQITGVAIHRR